VELFSSDPYISSSHLIHSLYDSNCTSQVFEGTEKS
jgi:hypothetical protein